MFFCGFHFGIFTYLLTWSTLFLTKKFLKHIDKVLITCLFLTQYEKVIIFRHKQTLFVIHGGSQLIFKMFRYVASSVFNKQGGLAPKDLEPSLFIYQAVQLAKSDKTSTNSQIAPHSFTMFFLGSRIYNEEFFLRFRILPSVAFYFISSSFSFSLIPLTCFFSQGTCYWELLVDVAPQHKQKLRILFFLSRIIFSLPSITFSVPKTKFSSQRIMFSLPRIIFSFPRIMFYLSRLILPLPRIMFSLQRTMFFLAKIILCFLCQGLCFFRQGLFFFAKAYFFFAKDYALFAKDFVFFAKVMFFCQGLCFLRQGLWFLC